MLASVLFAALVATNAPAVVATTPSAPAVDAFNQIENPARIMADTTYYDGKEGLVVFKGHVHVDDAEYQLHADRAYLYLSETNSLDRIAAIGSVALTNGMKRAYGEKLSYNRESGLVVLNWKDEAHPALVVDVSEDGERTVRGQRIRFWINSEQIEVDRPVIDVPKVNIDESKLTGLKN